MKIIKAIIALITVCLIIYTSYWIIKKVSYTLFYEDMVEETVRSMVKQDSLNIR